MSNLIVQPNVLRDLATHKRETFHMAATYLRITEARIH